MTQRNEHCPIISDPIQPHTKNKTMEKAKHEIQTAKKNIQFVKLFESLLPLVHELKFCPKLAK